LYHSPTASELALEPHLAALGRVVRFQHPLLGSFADFAFLAEKVVVEVDGKSHRTKKGRESDALRDAKMQKHGWTVLRVPNETVLADAAGWVASVLEPKLKEIDDGHAD
jgi:very-short-patch-repair endonuclease